MDSAAMKQYFFNNLCRICAEKSTKLIPIFEIKLLALKIYKCLPIKVTSADELPTNICEMCLLKVDESYLLYETCFHADLRLKKLWKDLIKPVEHELFDQNIQGKDILISDENYQPGCTIENNKCQDDEYVLDNAKNIPVSVILVNDSVVFNQGLENQNFQKTSDVLIPSDIIINMGGENDFNILDCDKGPGFENDNMLGNLPETLPNSIENNVQTQELPQTRNVSIPKELVKPEKVDLMPTKVVQESSQEKPFLCDTCGKSFKHSNNLKSHVKIHSAHRKKYTCKICNKSFFTNFFLQEHMNAHTGETPYKCQVCGREFREKVHLRQHKWTHSTEKFLCPVCGNHFNRKGNMTEHIKKYHSSSEEFTCPICAKSFSSQALLKSHHKRHLNKEPYFCSLCGKEFRHSGSLTYHRRTAHTGEKPFQCNYCEERFSLRSVQKIHERKKHTFEYPYKCTFCSRMFNNSSSLKNHSYVHMKEKMFGCDICGKKFSRNSNLLVSFISNVFGYIL
ncbi:UNVERIFIED_CONTAM: hypothetical protein PYX00_007436 [Menopon gallinae]|uniref:Zinc finger protein n=1 Tax=Menopon gallinae TaxID=328185 RepID=A0AAW2HJ83_9NEOP